MQGVQQEISQVWKSTKPGKYVWGSIEYISRTQINGKLTLLVACAISMNLQTRLPTIIIEPIIERPLKTLLQKLMLGTLIAMNNVDICFQTPVGFKILLCISYILYCSGSWVHRHLNCILMSLPWLKSHQF